MEENLYYAPLDIGCLLRSNADVALFMEYMIEQLEKLSIGKGVDYIPPIVYNAMGRTYNIHYNFLIKCLSDFAGEDAIYGDFAMEEEMHEGTLKNGIFLVVGIFENYYGLARVNNKKVDLGRYKSSGTIQMSDRFYNVILMQNRKNIRRMSGVPFSESELKKIVFVDKYTVLENIAKAEGLHQIAFGHNKYKEYLASVNSIPEIVEF